MTEYGYKSFLQTILILKKVIDMSEIHLLLW